MSNGCATECCWHTDKRTEEETIYIDGVKTGEGTIDNIVMGKYSLSEPFDLGVDNGGSVIRKEYTSPFKFSDNLDKVVFELN